MNDDPKAFITQAKPPKKVSTITPYLLAKTFVAAINSSIMPTAHKRQGRKSTSLQSSDEKLQTVLHHLSMQLAGEQRLSVLCNGY